MLKIMTKQEILREYLLVRKIKGDDKFAVKWLRGLHVWVEANLPGNSMSSSWSVDGKKQDSKKACTTKVQWLINDHNKQNKSFLSWF